MPTLTANGIDIYYERAGAGPQLLFFNGSGSTLASSGMLVQPFTERFDVVAHDQRGLGRTSIPPGPYSMADYAADGAALCDHLGWDRCRVFGVSFGGMVAQEFAVTWPERVERLALACTSAGGPGAPSYPLHEFSGLPDEDRARIAMKILDTRYSPEWLAANPGDRMLADMIIATRMTGSKSAEVRRGEVEQLEARSRHDVFDRLPAITCPTLVAAGRYDGISPPANAEAIGRQILGSEVRFYEGGHAFFAQDPAALPELWEFLAA